MALFFCSYSGRRKLKEKRHVAGRVKSLQLLVKKNRKEEKLFRWQSPRNRGSKSKNTLDAKKGIGTTVVSKHKNHVLIDFQLFRPHGHVLCSSLLYQKV
ncbi:hypothetical protein CEXT_770271 [Caerostris extrusa]|uniref:Uncharacterized protein n=1 Tax=Caerostris extrusa TaxID=172846 RepID=A0AAV4P8V0_CAEEX|nr:hypothetical protein CEXT_770271 [Caerostris extrusa]